MVSDAVVRGGREFRRNPCADRLIERRGVRIKTLREDGVTQVRVKFRLLPDALRAGRAAFQMRRERARMMGVELAGEMQRRQFDNVRTIHLSSLRFGSNPASVLTLASPRTLRLREGFRVEAPAV